MVDEAALCGCMAQMTPHPLGQTPCVFTAYQGPQPAPVGDLVALRAEVERLRARLSGLRIDVATLRAERDALAAKIERLRDAANRAALHLDHDDWCALVEGCWPVQVFVPGDTPAASCTCRHAEALAAFRTALNTPEGEK